MGDWAEPTRAMLAAALTEAVRTVAPGFTVAVLVLAVGVLLAVVVAVAGIPGLVIAAVLGASSLAPMTAAETAAPILATALTDSTAPTGDAEEDDARELREAHDYRRLLQQLAEQDRRGEARVTQIRVVAVRDAGGETLGWRVQLPSTQEWSPTNEDGPLNDIRTDIVLTFFPGLETQYERAAWQAMTDAGVFDDDAPIMFTGWSLGGMLAAEMSADPRVAGRVQSVVTAGSPIDRHQDAIPAGVRVTQINNGIDPVHALELAALPAQPPSEWQTYEAVAWPIHDAAMYSAEAARLLPEPRAGDEVFFAAAGDAYEDVHISEYTRGS